MWELLGSGAFWFGVVIGFVTYWTLKHARTVGISDIGGVIAAIGGGVIITLFQGRNFDEYAIGLAVGFFIYLVLSLVLGLIFGPERATQTLGHPLVVVLSFSTSAMAATTRAHVPARLMP